MTTTNKREVAARDLLRRYLAERQRPSPSRELPNTSLRTSSRTALILTAIDVPLQELGRIPGYRANTAERLWQQLYREVTRIYGTGSIRKIIIESAPNVGWLPKFRITIDPRDETGLVFQDLALILELLPQFKIVLLEIALDFPLDSIVDTSFVQAASALRQNVDASRRNWAPRKVGHLPK